MNNKVRLYVVIALVLSGGVLAWRYFLSSQSTPSETAEQAPAIVPGRKDSSGFTVLEREELLALLSDARVQTYFQRQQDKQALSAYFSERATEVTDEEAWQLIESIEKDGRIFAYEAMALKLAWLERNSANKVEFDTAAEALIEEYWQRSVQGAKDYDPYSDVPGFAEYKEEEKRIVREVQQMSTFPDGLSRQEYLRKRLQEAREKAYGS